MTTSQIADDVRVSIQLSSPGHDQDDRANQDTALLQLLGEAEEVKLKSDSTSLKSAKQVNINAHGKCCQNNEDSGGAVFECQSGSCGYCIGGDQWHHHPQCWTKKRKAKFLEALLMVTSFLLSFATAGAFYFTQALAVVGSHDPVVKHSLAAFNKVFAASFLCNFLGVLICLILQYRREYHQYKKISLIISNTASFLFMVLGYGLVIAFNIQRS